MSRPGDRVQRELATPDPCFLFRLLPPIQNAPIPGERLTRNAPGSTTRNRVGRGRSPSGWTAASLRTTSSLNIGYVLMIFSRPLVPPASTASVLARPQVLRFFAPICYSSRSPCHGSHVNPPARHTEFSLGTVT